MLIRKNSLVLPAAILAALAIVVGTVVAARPAEAGGPKAPKHTVLLVGSGAVLGINDLGDVGPTPGDIRTLSLALSTEGGEPRGRAEIVQTLTRQVADVGTAMKSVVLTLDDGAVTALGLTTFADFTSPSGRPSDPIERIAITGGTGAYKRAAGEVEITVLPEFRSKWLIRFTRR